MSIVTTEVMAFDVERALSRALAIRCETFACQLDQIKFRIGNRWNLVVTQEQLERLWADCDQPSTMKAAFDAIKDDCLAYQSYQR